MSHGFGAVRRRAMRDDPEDGTQGRADFGAPGTGCLVGPSQGRLALHKTDGFEGHAAHGFGGFRAPFARPEPRGTDKIEFFQEKQELGGVMDF